MFILRWESNGLIDYMSLTFSHAHNSPTLTAGQLIRHRHEPHRSELYRIQDRLHISASVRTFVRWFAPTEIPAQAMCIAWLATLTETLACLLLLAGSGVDLPRPTVHQQNVRCLLFQLRKLQMNAQNTTRTHTFRSTSMSRSSCRIMFAHQQWAGQK